jgi:glutaredoxin
LDEPLVTNESIAHGDGESGVSSPLFGSILLWIAGALVALDLIDRAAGLSIWMPRSWHSHRTLWHFLAICCLASGVLILRSRRPPPDWTPSQPGARFKTVRLYTREGCHLCDQAKDTLLQYSAYLPEIEEIDVDRHPEHLEAYAECVPVVEIDGKIRFRGQVNEVLLRRLIEGVPPHA